MKPTLLFLLSLGLISIPIYADDGLMESSLLDIQQTLQRSLQQSKSAAHYDLSTDTGRKAYLLDHRRYPTQYQGTDGEAQLQRDADSLVGKTLPQTKSFLEFLREGTPSLKEEQLKTMSEADIRQLCYASFKAEGKGISKARELSEKMPLPTH